MSFLSLDKLTIIRKTVSLSFFLGILLSLKLWHSDRLFPLVPAFDFLPTFSPTINYVILGLFLVSLVFVFFSANKKWLLISLSILLVLLLQDQMRWQPWVYMYVLMLIPFLLNIEKISEVKKINYLQIIIIGTYIWTGIHKLHPNFIDIIFRSILVDMFRINNSMISDSFLQLGYSIPLIEIGIGLLLIFPKYRRTGVFLAIGTHCFIILYIFSFGALSNSVVYPWNIAMILFVYFLFLNSKNNISTFKERDLKYLALNSFILLVMAVLPALHFANKWDTFLSFTLYSGKPKNYYILVKNDSEVGNEIYQEYYKTIDGMTGGKIIDITLWSFKELNVPFYPEKRIFEKLGSTLCDLNNDKVSMHFMEFDIPLWDRFIYKETVDKQSSLYFLEFETPLNFSEYDSFTCSDLEN